MQLYRIVDDKTARNDEPGTTNIQTWESMKELARITNNKFTKDQALYAMRHHRGSGGENCGADAHWLYRTGEKSAVPWIVKLRWYPPEGQTV